METNVNLCNEKNYAIDCKAERASNRKASKTNKRPAFTSKDFSYFRNKFIYMQFVD